MNHFEQFENSFAKLISGKGRIVVGGYDLSGSYASWLVKRITGEMPMIVDSSLCIFGFPVYRELALEDLDPASCFGLASGREYADMFARHGIPYESIQDFGYYQYLERTFGVDLVATVKAKDLDFDARLSTNSGASRQIGLYDLLDSKLSLNKGAKVLDIGCGKGAAMVIMNSFFADVDGIELSPGLCGIARDNFKRLGQQSEVWNVSAVDYDGYGLYDVLYMYDPFRGEVFRDAIRTIADQARTGAWMIYANPYQHKDVTDTGRFVYCQSCDSDFWHRDVKVYRAR